MTRPNGTETIIRYAAWIPIAALALLVGCANPSQDAGALMASYTLLDDAIAAYASQPGSNPATTAKIRACETAAWVFVKPVADAMAAGTTPTSAALSAAFPVIGPLQNCLTTAGVKF